MRLKFFFLCNSIFSFLISSQRINLQGATISLSSETEYMILYENVGFANDTIRDFESVLTSIDSKKFPNDSDLGQKYKVITENDQSTAFWLRLSSENYEKLSNNPKISVIEKIIESIAVNSTPVTLNEARDSNFNANFDANEANVRIHASINDLEEKVGFPFTKDFSQWKTQRNAPWHLGRISSTFNNPLNFSPYGQEYYYPPSKNSVVVYVVDSGIDPSHSEFNGNVRIGANFVTTEDNVDTSGHGTAVAALINGKNNGVAKGASVVSVKVLNSENIGTTTMFYQGLNWILNDKKTNYPNAPAIVNFSINLTVDSPLLESAFKKLQDLGVLVIASSGNNFSDECNFFPGNSDHALIVSSVQPGNDTFDSLDSNFGDCIDILAPGSKVFTALASSKDQVRPYVGTSFAAGIVSGLGALILSNEPTLSPADLYDTIVGNAMNDVISNVPANTTNRMIWNGYSGLRSQFSYSN
ncbi:Subtilisin-like protease 8 [Smittium culicis]|uniref:Subtilisin-like protease 8 n=2 Tax=Smittium culicis TaxID=133412 RepID=A0A1R1YA75_9FUNG|nr:Subtilisin-like protease 8 [Smittium culicis]